MPMPRRQSPCRSGARAGSISSSASATRRLNNIMATCMAISSSLLNGTNVLPITSAQSQHLRRVRNAHTYFCGPSWTEISSDCRGRQRCTSDQECTVPGHFCYGDIECDVSDDSDAHQVDVQAPILSNQGRDQEQDGKDAGASSGSGSEATGTDMLLSQADLAHTRFCKSEFFSTHCSIHLFCGDDSPCPDNMACVYSECNIHELREAERLKKEEEEAARSSLTSREQMLATLDPDDPIRFNSCGRTWTDANDKCGVWCWSESSECPEGEGCFGDTSCYNAAGL